MKWTELVDLKSGEQPDTLNVMPLARLASPFRGAVWEEMDSPLRPSEVRAAIQDGRLLPPGSPAASREDHAARVAWFAVHGWEDPIEVDIGIPEVAEWSSWWPIIDGNHRFAAAVFLKAQTIRGIFSGSLDYAEEAGLLAEV
jgi:hypothetical protein